MIGRTMLLMLALLVAPAALSWAANKAAFSAEEIQATVQQLVERHGAKHRERIELGVLQVAGRWWPDDGDTGVFREFCTENFVADRAELSRAFARLQFVLEQLDGRLHEIRRELLAPKTLDSGPVMAVDELLANVDLSTHVDDDLFQSKVAFFALLNFPVHSLTDRLEQGAQWDRETWARSRMMDRFAFRVPAEVSQQISRALTAASSYIDQYNIHMDRLVTADGRRLFPEGLRLITHWGLRDELASRYSDSAGLEKQRLIHQVMQRIVRQEIPKAVIDNPDLMWCPETNELSAVDGDQPARPATREPDTRYARILDVYRAVRQADPYVPTAPTFIARRFELGRQIPEKEVEALLVSVLKSAEVGKLARLIERRLGRPLEPFDIWYSGFKSRGSYSEEELDRIVGQKYRTREDFERALPGILQQLGFTEQRSGWLADHIVVDPSRGAGHALGAARREDKAHLRTRVGPNGMDYKGYNIAIHELGHNVEQVFSLNGIDHWWLNGVPNTAFTEALAFVFQARDLELLGLPRPADEVRRTEALSTLWGTYEIGGVALVDMRIWRWMYENPEATPAQLREATLRIARDVWNTYYAPHFGVRDQEILAIYSHMVAYALYLPDYPVGHIIAFQVADKLRRGDFGEEFERVSRQGQLTPDAWMRGAVGEPLSSAALLKQARWAIEALGG